jgi:hypothetical protein
MQFCVILCQCKYRFSQKSLDYSTIEIGRVHNDMHYGGSTSIGHLGPCSTNMIDSIYVALHKVAKASAVLLQSETFLHAALCYILPMKMRVFNFK